MNPFEVVLAIVAMAMITGIIIRRMELRSRHGEAAPAQENQQLRREVEELRDRLKVLERIAVEKENSLSNEIESLRDR